MVTMKILLLTHYFPPIGGPGARRMLGWVNGFYADDSAHEVVVITPEAHERDPYYQPKESYEGQAAVIRPTIFDPARLARGGEDAKKTQPTQLEKATERRGLASRIRPWLLLPDQRRFANGPLTKAAAEVIEEHTGEEPILVLTSSPYSSIHLAGKSLKQHYGEQLIWIADFRDDWFHPTFFPHPNSAYRAYNRKLERNVLRIADGLSVVSRKTFDKIKSRHEKKFPASFWRIDSDDSKWRWIPNGFDPTGVQEILNEPVEASGAEKTVRLLFSGTLWQNHSLEALVAALDAIAEETKTRFEFTLAGRVIEQVPEPKNPDLVEIKLTGWKPYEESLSATRQADLLLVHTGPESQDIKIKVFDSAAVKRPMLVLGPEDSATVRLVKEHVADPLIADQNDQSAIETALRRYLSSEEIQQHAFDGVPEEYNRLLQAKRLLTWADQLAGSIVMPSIQQEVPS